MSFCIERDYMSLPGKVIEVFQDSILVEVTPKPECNGCHACTGLLGGEKKSAPRKIKALKGEFSPEPGDEVILDINPGEGSIAAILVFGVPMFSFFAALLTAPQICSWLGWTQSDQNTFLIAFVGLFIGFVILAMISRTRRAEKLSLKVVEIVGKKSPRFKMPGTK
jgi:positive regulator of sigma E activity